MESAGSSAQADRPMSFVKRLGLSPKMIILAVVCLSWVRLWLWL